MQLTTVLERDETYSTNSGENEQSPLTPYEHNATQNTYAYYYIQTYIHTCHTYINICIYRLPIKEDKKVQTE